MTPVANGTMVTMAEAEGTMTTAIEGTMALIPGEDNSVIFTFCDGAATIAISGPVAQVDRAAVS